MTFLYYHLLIASRQPLAPTIIFFSSPHTGQLDAGCPGSAADQSTAEDTFRLHLRPPRQPSTVALSGCLQAGLALSTVHRQLECRRHVQRS